MDIIDFYNSGAQVQIKGSAVDMTHSFSGGTGTGEPEDIGYVPRSNSKLAEGASHDVIEHGGKLNLLLKRGHVYSVKLNGSEDADVISAEEGHVILPLPNGTEVEVEEYVAPEPSETPEGDDTPGEATEAPESGAEEAPDAEGTLGSEDEAPATTEGDDTPDSTEE